MNPKDLCNSEIITHLKSIATRERSLLDEFLAFLREVDRRKLYATQGYPTLFAFLVKALGYDEATAFRRIDLMRAIKEVPEIEAAVRAGDLSLTTVGIVQSYMRAESKVRSVSSEEKKDLFQQAQKKSKNQAEKALLQRATQGGFLKSTKRESARAISPTLTEVKINTDEEFLKHLERLKELYFHINPNATLGEIIKWAMKNALKHLDPIERVKRTQKVKPDDRETLKTSVSLSQVKAQPRKPPAAITKAIWTRDDGICQYISPTTRLKCGSRTGIEVDHIQSYARGGMTELKNLQLLCATHHQLKTEAEFGRRY